MESLPYIPGSQPPYDLPLGRFLPPLRPGVISRWLQMTSSKGSWVIDPLGSNPAFPLEAARAGYRVLFTCNNPVLALILEVLAEAPKKEMLQSILADLALLKKGDDRLEDFIQGLYSSECPSCGKVVPAQSFLWKKGENSPYKRRIKCDKCGGDGEFDLFPSDLEKINSIEKSSLHLAWALSRLGELNEEEEHAAKDALGVYLARPLTALFTIITKSETLDLTPQRRKWLYALLLSVCDDGNCLWQVSGGRSRPRKLSIPGYFIENNLWIKLEESIENWSSQAEAVPITHYPELPPESGGICISHGRLRSLLPLPTGIQTDQVLAVFPRTNQAFWTLSALWSGWIWGRKTLPSVRSGFERQHYDWHWHAHAIRNTLSPILRVGKDLNLFIIAPELTQGFLLSLIVGGQAAGFHLTTANLRVDDNDIQIHFNPGNISNEVKVSDIKSLLREAVKSHLMRKGQPANYLELYAVSLSALAQKGRLFKDPIELPTELQNLIEGSLMEIMGDPDFLKQYGSGSFESQRTWWLVDHTGSEQPLSDRVELKFLELLKQQQAWSVPALEAEICSFFPGFMTPNHGLFYALLESYSDPVSSQGGIVRLRMEDDPEKRTTDLQEARQRLEKLSLMLGFTCEGENPLRWLGKDKNTVFSFYLTTRSIISPFVMEEHHSSAENCIVVLPGSRAGLLGIKLHQNLYLAETAAGMRFLKFRHLKELSAVTRLTKSKWIDQLNTDPIQWSSPRQISMLEPVTDSDSDS